MLATQARGLATCPQVSFVRFQEVIAQQLDLGPDEVATCGLPCGYEEKQAAVNHLDMRGSRLTVSAAGSISQTPMADIGVKARWRQPQSQTNI
jgi:hypothetical protein